MYVRIRSIYLHVIIEVM